jgi:hypothetical protein
MVFVLEMGHTWPEGLEVSTTTQSQIFHCQMAEFNVHLKQQSVNEFLPAEGESQLVFMNVCSQCVLKQLGTYILLNTGKMDFRSCLFTTS